MALVDKYKAYRKVKLGKWVDFDGAYGMQCVDLVKDFVKEFHGVTLGSFSGSAFAGWESGSPFDKKWKKVVYKDGLVPQLWDVIFFDKTTKMPYGHVAIALIGTTTRLAILEQNGKVWAGEAKNGDEIRESIVTYKTPMKVVGWYKYTG
jgi:CHAP domain